MLQWAADTLNEQKDLFPVRLQIDAEAMANYVPPMPEAPQGDGSAAENEAKPDSVVPLHVAA